MARASTFHYKNLDSKRKRYSWYYGAMTDQYPIIGGGETPTMAEMYTAAETLAQKEAATIARLVFDAASQAEYPIPIQPPTPPGKASFSVRTRPLSLSANERKDKDH